MKVSLVSLPVPDPIKAHGIYTEKLGFISKFYDEKMNLAIVVSPEDVYGTSILLEPCQGNFLEAYQKSAYEANLPIMVFAVKDVKKELERLKECGVRIRPDLDNPECELENMFEDGCGNILMIEKAGT